MTETQGKEKRIRILVSLAGTALLFLLVSLRFDFYYDLNDDWLMGHILSGAYTGTPESRNIQSLYPLTLLLSGLYRVLPGIPWYPVFLLLCEAGSVFTVTYCAMRQEERAFGRKGSLAAALAVLLFFPAVFLYHLVFLQYSVACGMLVLAAAALLLTQKKCTPGTCIAPVLLLYLSFLLRSEMTLFLLVFPALAFLYRQVQAYRERKREENRSEAKSGERKRNLLENPVIACLLMLAVVLLGFGIFEAADRAAYGSASWQEFRNFFDARTELYDFYGGAPDYEANRDYYDSCGITEEQVTLYQNYNFALDERIDAKMTEDVVSLARQKTGESSRARLSAALWSYLHEVLFGKKDMPWSMFSMIFYGIAVISILFRAFRAKIALIGKDGAGQDGSASTRAVWNLVFLAVVFAARSALYLYLLYNNRPVTRLTHCLYLLEAALVLYVTFGDADRSRAGRASRLAVLVLYLALFAAGIRQQDSAVMEEEEKREENNIAYTDLTTYAAEHPEEYILTDVYSTVDFTEKLFTAGEMPVNWDLAGGWAAKSPLYEKKLAFCGIDAGGADLLLEENVCFAAKEGSDVSWLETYYESRGISVRVKKEDTAGSTFVIYRVEQE